MTRRGVLMALIQTWATAGKSIDFQTKELRVRIDIPLVVTDGNTEVRITPGEIMAALTGRDPR